MPTPGTESGWSAETLHSWGGGGGPYTPSSDDRLAVSTDEATLYVGRSGQVRAVDLTTFAVGSPAAIGNTALAVGSDGYLYTTNGGDLTRSSPNLTTVVADTSWLDQTAFAGYTLQDLCLGRDGHLYVTGYLTSGGRAAGPWRVWRIDPPAPPSPPAVTFDSAGSPHDGLLSGTSLTLTTFAPPLSGFGGAFEWLSGSAHDSGVTVAGVPHVGGGAWTLEARVQLNPASVGGAIAGWANDLDQGPQLYANGTPFDVSVFWTDGGGFQALTSTGGALGDFLEHAVAASYDGTTVRLLVDGIVVASQASTGQTAYTGDFCIGIDQFTVPDAMDHGIIDEVRLSDIARYTGAYTPAAAAFATDANTVALFHLDGWSGIYPGTGGGPATAVAITALDEAVYGYHGIAVTSDSMIWLGLMKQFIVVSGADVFDMNRVRKYDGAITDIDVQDPLAVGDVNTSDKFFNGENIAGIYADANDNVLIPLISQYGQYLLASASLDVPYSWFLHLHPGGTADLVAGQWDVQFLDGSDSGAGGASAGLDVGSQMFALLYAEDVIPTETSGTGWSVETLGPDLGWYAPAVTSSGQDSSAAGSGIVNLSIPWTVVVGETLVVTAISATAIGAPSGWTLIDNAALGGHFAATWTRTADGTANDHGPFPMGGDVWDAAFLRIRTGSVVAHISIDNTTALNCVAAAVSHDSQPDIIIGLFLGESGSAGSFGAPSGWTLETQIPANPGTGAQPLTVARKALTASDAEPFGPETAVATGLVSGARRGIAITVKGATGYALYRKLLTAPFDGANGGSFTFVTAVRGSGLAFAGPLYLADDVSGTTSPLVFPGLHGGHPGFSIAATGVIGWHIFGYDMAALTDDGLWIGVGNPGLVPTGDPPDGVSIQYVGGGAHPLMFIAWTHSYPDVGGNVADGLLGASLAAQIGTGGMAMAATNLYFLDGPIAGSSEENLVRRLVGPSAGLGFVLGHHMSFT